jgi:Family of unknown function (DUF6235)
VPGRSNRSRLVKGEDRLEDWSGDADQIEQNAVYEALFAVAEGSAESQYETHEEHRETGDEFVVVIRDDLVVKVRCIGPGAFAIVYIGRPDGVPAQ